MHAHGRVSGETCLYRTHLSVAGNGVVRIPVPPPPNKGLNAPTGVQGAPTARLRFAVYEMFSGVQLECGSSPFENQIVPVHVIHLHTCSINNMCTRPLWV